MAEEEQITVVDVEVDIVELDESIDHAERERRRSKAYTVEVRTPAGFSARFRVHPSERVETLARHAERFFIRRGELAAGNYRLERLADGTTVPLVASATLRAARRSPGQPRSSGTRIQAGRRRTGSPPCCATSTCRRSATGAAARTATGNSS